MLNNIELFNPDFIIDCSKINHSGAAYQIMRDHDITRSYVYGMCYKISPLIYDFLKVGMSCPTLTEKREHQVGERIVRQLSWATGWPGPHVRSSHGADFWLGITEFLIPEKKVPNTISRNDIVVAVWDISKRMVLSDIRPDDEFKATAWAEGSLADQYKELNGRLPYLNVMDPSKTKAYTTGYIPNSVWSNLFVG